MDGVAAQPSASSPVARPFGLPFAPTLTEAVNVGVRQVRLTWTAADDNGSPITDYQISVNGGAWTSVGTSLTTTRTMGSNGTSYSFRVRGVNAAGPGAQSNQRSVTTWSVPGTPNVSVSGGDARVTASWNTPADGGTAISAHQAKVTTGGLLGRRHDADQPRYSGNLHRSRGQHRLPGVRPLPERRGLGELGQWNRSDGWARRDDQLGDPWGSPGPAGLHELRVYLHHRQHPPTSPRTQP